MSSEHKNVSSRSRLDTDTPKSRSRLGLGIIRLIYNPDTGYRTMTTMETAVLQLQVRSCGTTFQLNCDKLTLAFNDLSGY